MKVLTEGLVGFKRAPERAGSGGAFGVSLLDPGGSVFSSEGQHLSFMMYEQ